MQETISQALVSGCERLSAWADVLDRINVYPVADGDTGRNLRLSLTPLLHTGTRGADRTVRELLLAARGNSGNIATRFFSSFVRAAGMKDLPDRARDGREKAWRAVHNPQPGTMLSVFDALEEALAEKPDNNGWSSRVLERLRESVELTAETLPEMREAGCVDAGALGMYIFFEAFFKSLSGNGMVLKPVTESFAGKLSIREGYSPAHDGGYCVDLVLKVGEGSEVVAKEWGELGESVIAVAENGLVKLHLHTNDREALRGRISRMGDLVQWSADDLAEQTKNFRERGRTQALHIVTDGAGSITREDAARLGVTIMDSYVNIGDLSVPESHVDPDRMYAAMRQGVSVSTSQASVYERHQNYEKITSLHERALYLCVGSAFTGNHEVAKAWIAEKGLDDRLVLVDTALASGKLGLAVLAAARYSLEAGTAEDVIARAKRIVDSCRECICPERLQYLAAGGRLSKTASFFGDLFRVKPVVTPTSEGAQKMAQFRKKDDQAAFVLDLIERDRAGGGVSTVLLEYTDNREWLEETVRRQVGQACPDAEILVRPLSVTTGAHCGPGTFAVAWLPTID
ncbi:MAG: DegV family protein [Desulfatibacillaceae bacterium]